MTLSQITGRRMRPACFLASPAGFFTVDKSGIRVFVM
jgi:hypothetical protein